MSLAVSADVCVSVIIPVYNKWELTKQCLVSLHAHDKDKNFEVIVVDNNSTDATSTECLECGQALFEGRFSYLRQSTNKNFAGACNIGGKAGRGEFLFFLNNDTIVTPGWLDPLLKTYEQYENVGAVGPLLLYPEFFGHKDRVQHAGVAVTPSMKVTHIYEGFPADHPVVNQPRSFQIITGAAFLIPRTTFFEVNGFDERYINGFEDVDLCAKLCAAGYTMRVEPQSRIYHLQGQTPGRHAHEAHNSRLCSRGAFCFLKPDLETYLECDGFTLELSRWVTSYPRMSPQVADELTRTLLHKGNESMVAEKLLEEPLWFEGYDWLTTRLEHMGRAKEALTWACLASRLKPDPDTTISLLTTARKAGDDESILRALNYILQYSFTMRSLTNRARSFLRSAAYWGAQNLVKQGEYWLERKEAFRQETLLPTILRLKNMGLLDYPLGEELVFSYACFRELQEDTGAREDDAIKIKLHQLPRKPLFSLIMPISSPDVNYLKQALDSIQAQLYTNWELYTPIGGATSAEVSAVLYEYAANDSRINVIEQEVNNSIRQACSTALARLSGEYCLLIDQVDMLSSRALAHVALGLASSPHAKLVYGDEDEVTMGGRYGNVYCKPSFDPDLLCGDNYFGYTSVYLTELVRSIGGFSEGSEGAQEYDLALRCVEKILPQEVLHIPEVLYHKRGDAIHTAAGITSPRYAIKRNTEVVNKHLQRIGRNATAIAIKDTPYRHVIENVPQTLPKVSLLVPLMQGKEAGLAWARLLIDQTDYPAVEIVFYGEKDTSWQDVTLPVQYIRDQTMYTALQKAIRFVGNDIIGHIGFGVLPESSRWLEQIALGVLRPEVGAMGGRLCTAEGLIAGGGYDISLEGLLHIHAEQVRKEQGTGYFYQHNLLMSVLALLQSSFFARTNVFQKYYCAEFGGAWHFEMCMKVREKGLRVLSTPLADLITPVDSALIDDEISRVTPQQTQQFVERWGKIIYSVAISPSLEPVPGGYVLRQKHPLLQKRST